MNLNSLTGPVGSGLKFLETTVEKQVKIVKTVGEDVITIGETVRKEAMIVGESVGEDALNVGVTVGNSALTVGKTVGEGAVVVGETVGDGVVSVGKSALDCVNFIDGSVNNLVKLIRMCQNIYALACRFKEYIEDDSVLESTIALTIWLLVCYFFQIWMVPLGILIIYIKKLIIVHIFGEPEEDENVITNSLKTKVEAIQEILGLVKAVISTLEALLEKIFGFINIKSLHLSFLIIALQVVITLVLMLMPIPCLLMVWGISLYTKKFLKKKTSPEKVAKDDGKNNVSGTEDPRSAVGDFMTLNFTKCYGQLKDVLGKFSSKSD